MKPILLFLLILTLFSCVPKQGGSSLQTVQDSELVIPEEFQDYPLVILKDSNTVYMNENRELVLSKSTVYYVQKEHPALLREIVVPYSKVSEEPVDIQCAVRYPDGSSWELRSFDIKKANNSRSYDMSVIGNSGEAHYFSVPKYGRGVRIKVDVIRKHKGNLFTPALFFRDKYPILEKSITVDTTASHHIFRNEEGLSVRDTLVGSRHYYKASNCKPQKSRHYSKHDEKWYAAVHLSRFPMSDKAAKGWQDLGDSYLLRIGDGVLSDAAVKNLAQSEKGSSVQKSCENYFNAIVNRVRYLFYLDSVSAIIPEHPSTVLRVGYGDCKGMSNLFLTLLRETYPDISAGLALVATEGLELHNDAPSLDRFNHMVCWVVINGDTLYVDPTNSAASWNSSFWPLVHRKTLLLEDGKSRVSSVLANSFFKNRVETTNQVKLDTTKEHPLYLEGTITLTGYTSSLLYRYTASMNGADRKQYLKQWLLKRFNIDSDTFSFPTIGYDTSILHYTTGLKKQYIAVDGGGIKLSVPSTFGGKTSYTTIENEGYFSFKELEQVDKWNLPKGFSEVDKHSFNTTLSRGHFSLENNTIQRFYTVKSNPLVNGGDLGSYFLDKRKINNTIIWR